VPLPPSSVPRAHARDEAIDARRYIAALRRSIPMMLAIVAVLTCAVLLISLAMSKTYQAQSQIIVSPGATSFGGTDAASEQRQLATIQTLVESPTVLDTAAKKLGRTRDDLQSKVSSALDPNANLITVQANDGSARGAAAVANAVSRAFLDDQAAAEKTSLQRAQSELESQISQLQAGADAQSASVQGQIRALQARAAELRVSQASAGSDLQIARAAEVPSGAASPRPLRNAVLALFVSLFIAVLAALGRDQLRPGVTDQREVAEILDLPVLAVIPEKPSKRRLRRAPLLSRIEHETYRTLSASLRLQLKPDREHVILTTSAMHAEGKTTVTMRLGRLLAESGRRTLIVSGDMRWPRLDGHLGLEGRKGFSDLLAEATDGPISHEAAERLIVRQAHREADVLPAGTMLGEAAATLLSSERLDAVFAALTELGYVYILVDAPPLLGLGDTQLLAAQADELLVVSRLQGLKLDTLIDLRSTLDRVARDPLGVVVIGGQATMSPYYAAPSTGPVEDDDLVLESSKT
jgi:capsular polysaccharide biosynthesis protein